MAKRAAAQRQATAQQQATVHFQAAATAASNGAAASNSAFSSSGNSNKQQRTGIKQPRTANIGKQQQAAATAASNSAAATDPGENLGELVRHKECELHVRIFSICIARVHEHFGTN
jgi:hypothetical protein